MKKILLLLTVLLLFLPSCKKETTLTPETAAERVLAEWAIPFVRADEDFVRTNFADLDGVKDAAVYLSEENDGTEFGFFALSDKSRLNEAQANIREYIASERQQVLSLAALYPGEELNARLSRYDSATVGTTGDLVYYFIAERDVAQRLLKGLKRAEP
ncbi:MAG: hypothetical protein E7585_00125 [Ruminococcaceae bacterium]|nr:hypothetical protein [Oscillospiraceae bacterium]